MAGGYLEPVLPSFGNAWLSTRKLRFGVFSLWNTAPVRTSLQKAVEVFIVADWHLVGDDDIDVRRRGHRRQRRL